ncbi:hypothetical protein [Chromobacterium haemolyticum]|uniref:hypothetical protein n=1 Tax=Chromobacterium haemolyticum TaxID=394935 RepID=UPI0013173C80|nr:hypothetical protein [Chromobacterium haemolyticum]BBH11733.1 hypothetical protein CH06BL_09810 [Chromobacterium haemolyticum]
MTIRNEDVLYCDFCGSSAIDSVVGFSESRLGNNVAICDTCVEVAMLLILQHRLGIDAKKGEDDGGNA